LKSIHDENLIISSQERKEKFRDITSGESMTQDAKKKKDTRKVKFFACHNFGHYIGQCLHKEKGGKEVQLEVVAMTKTQVDEFCKNFE
jgi:hypothetical protein